MSVEDFRDFLWKCPTPRHFCAYARKVLTEAGYVEYSEKKGLPEHPTKNTKGFIIRDECALIAFDIRGLEKGVVIGTHCDSPCFLVKPNGEFVENGQYYLGLSVYGGGLWHTFPDRDLRISGIVKVKNEEDQITNYLYDSGKGIATIPSIAMHFQTNRTMAPVFDIDKNFNAIIGQRSLKTVVAESLGVDPSKILDWELRLHDAQKAGYVNGFITSGRLDNLSSTYAALKSLLEFSKTEVNDGVTRIFASFDREEEGNDTPAGAGSDFLKTVWRFIFFDREYDVKSKSFIISADDAQGTHPLWPEKYEELHPCTLFGGIAIKETAKSNYATDSVGVATIKSAAEAAGVSTQTSFAKNMASVGTTIGPIISAQVGIRTVDVGHPLLGMHSARETVAWPDVEDSIKLFKEIYVNFDKHYKPI